MWDNFANILRKLGEKKPCRKLVAMSWLLARQNLKLKNSYILAKTGCLQPKLQDLKNYNIIFPL